MKICFVASSGGHWEELMCLKEIADANEAIFITEEGGQAEDCDRQRIVTVSQINRRENKFIIHFLKLFVIAIKIIKKEKPAVIITTGALVAYPFCIIGKILRCKIIYIESFARVHEQSLTGKLLYPLADLFLVQWKELEKYYPNSKYVGGIF